MNPNRNLQKALLKVDVRDKLRHIRRNPHRFSTPFSFHLQLARVFASLRDAHTQYSAPEPLGTAVALLPVSVRPYWTGENAERKRRFVIDEVYSDEARQLLGADVMEFDGRPILNAVRRVGQMSGCRREDEDCVRRGTLGLTLRSLITTGVVQDPTVTMKVTDVAGNVRVVELEWLLDYNQPLTPPEESGSPETGEPDDDGGMNMSATERNDDEHIEGGEKRNAVHSSHGDHVEVDADAEDEIKASRESLNQFTQRLETTLDLTNDRQHAAATKLSNTVHTLSSPSSSNAAHSVRSAFAASSPSSTSPYSLTSILHQGGNPGSPFGPPPFTRERITSSHRLLKATRITPTNGTAFGILRVESFGPGNPTAFLAEAGRLLSLLPATGLVVDVRRNPGGISTMTGALFQLIFSANKTSGGGPAIPYTYPLVMRATRFILRVLGRRVTSVLGLALRRLIGRHVDTGAEFTGPWANLPLGLSFENNNLKKYKGDRVVLLTDSTSFSAAELFTSLVKDSDDIAEKRVIVGVDPSTNGAGATVNSLEEIAESVRHNSAEEEDKRVFANLPKGVDFTTAAMRFYRAGQEAMGELVEHYGVPADVVYYENLLDVVFEDESLLTYVGQLLMDM